MKYSILFTVLLAASYSPLHAMNTDDKKPITCKKWHNCVFKWALLYPMTMMSLWFFTLVHGAYDCEYYCKDADTGQSVPVDLNDLGVYHCTEPYMVGPIEKECNWSKYRSGYISLALFVPTFALLLRYIEYKRELMQLRENRS